MNNKRLAAEIEKLKKKKEIAKILKEKEENN
jgi:hypothetical protein